MASCMLACLQAMWLSLHDEAMCKSSAQPGARHCHYLSGNVVSLRGLFKHCNCTKGTRVQLPLSDPQHV